MAAPQLEQLKAALVALQGVGQRSTKIFQTYKKFAVTPLNMKVEAGHLGEEGAALGEIATNFAEIAKGVQHELQSFRTAAFDDTETLYVCMFQNFAQAITAEASEQSADRKGIQDAELQIIAKQSCEYSSWATSGVNRVIDQLVTFIREASKIKRQVLGLSVTQIMSAIEVARFGDDTRGNITAMVNDLRQFEIQTDVRMQDIKDGLQAMNANLNAITQRDTRGSSQLLRLCIGAPSRCRRADLRLRASVYSGLAPCSLPLPSVEREKGCEMSQFKLETFKAHHLIAPQHHFKTGQRGCNPALSVWAVWPGLVDDQFWPHQKCRQEGRDCRDIGDHDQEHEEHGEEG